MFSAVKSTGVWGIDAYIVDVETNISTGLPCFDIVGLPDASVRESRERVRSALKNNGFKFPVSRIIVNLAPASVKKEGSVYDLPIMLSVLLASGEADFDVSDSVFVGELSLKGEIRPVNGLLSMAIAARENGFKSIYVPACQAKQAAVVSDINVFAIETINDLVNHLSGEKLLEPIPQIEVSFEKSDVYLDFADVAGQEFAKEAASIACAGGHNLLLIGPPGSGKSMIAKRIPSILPDMTFDEAIETSRIHSVAGMLSNSRPMINQRPFRSPHHTVSAPALSGGGSTPTPGEISLAHNGVLFLDELPEFPRQSMEAMRQPLEDGVITISRVSGSITYPCNIMFVAAMNPCPCGYFGHPTRKCTCTDFAVTKYLNKVSGPLLDRIDIQIEVPPVNYDELTAESKAEASSEIKKRVDRAREIQQKRFQGTNISSNACMSTAMIKKFCVLEKAADDYLKSCFERLSLSGRTYDRILKVARTIADLDSCDIIKRQHIAMAIRLRNLDNKYWNN